MIPECVTGGTTLGEKKGWKGTDYAPDAGGFCLDGLQGTQENGI
jgi:hypothetical protein